ncbi:hypothetical protein DICVIV_01534 [Dictyocaulus viviparus]|uniref:Uncharacterized protein n=1 Tax=Dictyocaulus viviparus TaxID=29172 RepID=A0A0D8YCB7_DICVI|nr:hypothetical protein DICVIV_01534 [Dictyocaulus viviparus]
MPTIRLRNRLEGISVRDNLVTDAKCLITVMVNVAHSVHEYLYDCVIGWTHVCISTLITRRYGIDVWQQIM